MQTIAQRDAVWGQYRLWQYQAEESEAALKRHLARPSVRPDLLEMERGTVQEVYLGPPGRYDGLSMVRVTFFDGRTRLLLSDHLKTSPYVHFLNRDPEGASGRRLAHAALGGDMLDFLAAPVVRWSLDHEGCVHMSVPTDAAADEFIVWYDGRR